MWKDEGEAEGTEKYLAGTFNSTEDYSTVGK